MSQPFLFSEHDQHAMQQALALARQAWSEGEVPVGAVVTDANGSIIGAGRNQTISAHDPSAHAEMVALRAAALACENYRLPEATVYVTLEPCAMCIGALLHARVKRVVYAASDPKTGACGSVLALHDSALNHQTRLQGGLLAEEASTLLRAFFKERRELSRQAKERARASLSSQAQALAVSMQKRDH